MGYFLGVVLGVIWSLSLAFTNTSVENLDQAYSVCRENGGLSKVRSDLIVNPVAKCKNGAKFELKESK